MIKIDLTDSKFNHFKYIVIGAKVMITNNIIFERCDEWNYCYCHIFYFYDIEIITNIIIKVISKKTSLISSKWTSNINIHT
jgi:hypothetical protein